MYSLNDLEQICQKRRPPYRGQIHDPKHCNDNQANAETFQQIILDGNVICSIEVVFAQSRW